MSNLLFGYMGVSLPTDLTINEEEVSLFREVAGDLGFALHMIEVEAQRDKSERTLRAIFDAAADGMLVADTESMRFVMGNRAMGRADGPRRVASDKEMPGCPPRPSC